MTVNEAVLVDTSVVSYIFNRNPLSEYYVDTLRGKHLLISFQTLEEIRFGAMKGNWGLGRMTQVLRHLHQYTVVWSNPELVVISASLRSDCEKRGHRLSTADAWIAATAIMLRCPVASHDRDFSRIPDLEVIRAPSA